MYCGFLGAIFWVGGEYWFGRSLVNLRVFLVKVIVRVGLAGSGDRGLVVGALSWYLVYV